jgi:Zn-dependent peptidase ImmA (M78 family)
MGDFLALGNRINNSMNVNSESTTPVKDPDLKEFIAFCRANLDYKKPAKVIVSDDHAKAVHIKAMAAYFPDKNFIWVLRGKRLRADWYRSLAHELVHHAQRERGDQLDGTDGSDCENEANGKAGVFLRAWGREHPTIFEPVSTP